MNQEIRVTTPDGAYSILVGGDLPSLPLSLQERGQGGEVCAIITNPHVGALYTERVAKALRANNITPYVIEVPDGEEYKTLETVRTVYDRLIDARLDRQSIIFALGGGVVGDLAGFVAATYLRGVPFVQMPTTLLAMVDASIGGKVAVNHPRGKNLIGAFKQPLAVIAGLNTLQTLPDAEWCAGMAEVVKHGIIGDAGLFEKLDASRGNWKLEIGSWIESAMRVKTNIVERDPFEQGERAKLNLGHTFGHALEKLSNYRLRHGDGVAIGLVSAARLAYRLQLCDATLVERIDTLLCQIGLPTRVPHEIPTEKILDAMQMDKKRIGSRLHFVLPRALGDVAIVDDVSYDDVRAVLQQNT